MKKTLMAALVAVLLAGPLTPLSAKSRPVEGVLNLNAASAEQLVLLPGIGKAKAEAIVAYRQAHPFKDPSELAEVKGIGPKMLEKLGKYLTVQGPTTLHEVSISSSATPKSAP